MTDPIPEPTVSADVNSGELRASEERRYGDSVEILGGDDAPVDVVEALRQANQETLDRLARKGAMVDPAALTGLRVQILVDLLFPRDGAFRSVLDAMFEKQLAEELANIERQHSRHKLMEGVHPKTGVTT